MASAAVIAIGVGAMSAPAFAGGNCFLGCGGDSGDTTNNDNSINNTANGGAGGKGGTGIGVGLGGEGGKGGKGGNATGITGGEFGGDGGNARIKNSGNATIERGAVKNDNTNKQKQGQLQGQLQGQKQSTNNANNSDQDVTVEGDVYEAADIPVATAYSAPLTSAMPLEPGVKTRSAARRPGLVADT